MALRELQAFLIMRIMEQLRHGQPQAPNNILGLRRFW